MAQFSAWLAGLFSSAPTRGLSGEDRKLGLAGAPGTFFNARLHRHEIDGDLVDNPGLLWSSRGSDGRRHGLKEHLTLQRGEGDTAQFTDVLVILNERDHRRSLERVNEPWSDDAARTLHQEFTRYCDDEGFQILRTSRPVRFGLIVDGSSELGGLTLGLQPGEFVTGLLPNFYTGPIANSRPVIGVHLNIPGAWEGYREVGTLYSDQLMFTIGNHGLDNFRHPALAEPGLYRLQQYLDGSFVHIVTPDGDGQYKVSSDEETGGPSVLTISNQEGAAVAYLVLAVLDQSATTGFFDSDGTRRSFDLDPPATEVVIEGSLTVDQPPPLVGTNDPPEPPPRNHISLQGHVTIVPDAVRERIFTLRESGALLQKVHFSRFMMGYDVYITRAGQISTSARDPSAVFQIRGRQVRLMVLDPALRLNGYPAELQKPLDLGAGAMIEVAGVPLEYRDLSGMGITGWPYLGEIRRAVGSTHMVFGGRYRFGRDRRCKVRLPDDSHNGNIHWDPERISGGTIRTRSGEVQQSRFYTDSIMVASEHAELDLRDEPVLQNIARHCFTFIRRGTDIHPLVPTEGAEGARVTDVHPGDEILVGNCLFQVSFPRDEPNPAALAAARLAEAADSAGRGLDLSDITEADVPAAAGLGEYGAPPEPPPPFQGIASYDSIISEGISKEPPAAAGLGEQGDAPPPPRPFEGIASYDSIIGERGEVAANLSTDPTVQEPPIAGYLPGEQAAPPAAGGAVEVVDEDAWMVELGRPGRVVLVGWMLSGDAVIGNHRGAEVVIPESRAEPDQTFTPREYLKLQKIRGRRGSAILLNPTEASLTRDGAPAGSLDKADGMQLEVIRRDADGEEDFRIQLSLGEDLTLPDPRARLLSVDTSDRLVAALYTLGLPLHAARHLRLGAIELDALFDGQSLQIAGYLKSYQHKQGFRPFFVRHGLDTYRTVPEDGRTLTLIPGDRLIIEGAIYEFQVP